MVHHAQALEPSAALLNVVTAGMPTKLWDKSRREKERKVEEKEF
jgi:hypothetical protein